MNTPYKYIVNSITLYTLTSVYSSVKWRLKIYLSALSLEPVP